MSQFDNDRLQKEVTVLKKFPNQNPNPVLRMSTEGRLLYANPGAEFIIHTWQVSIGETMPTELRLSDSKLIQSIELPVGNKTYDFKLVKVPEFQFINIYATDISALKALSKFPSQNPNPVLRMSTEGRLLYANPGAEFIIHTWNIKIGDLLPTDVRESVGQRSIETNVGDRVFSFGLVAIDGFDFINIYGTDITAAKDNEQILWKLSKYFSPQVYQSIFSGDLDVTVQTERKRLTVFFSDIKGFSSITEKMEPELLTAVLTDYLTKMTAIAVKYGGTVDKYIGDAIMVFFGAPSSKGAKQDAINCTRMALEMKESLQGIRQSWQEFGIAQPLDIRIGIHTDICTVGNFGSVDRLDYTTIGNGVNLASRLESNAATNQIQISESTYLLVQDEIHCKKLNEIHVKNISYPIQTYEVKGFRHAQESRPHFELRSDGLSLSIDCSTNKNTRRQKELLQQAIDYLDRVKPDE